MSYEPQAFDLRMAVIGAKKETTYGTALLDASLTHRLRFDGAAFAQITKQYRSDLDRAGKGHPWATERQEVQRAAAFQAQLEVTDFLAGWLAAFAMSKDTVTGTDPYTHTCAFENATNIAPVTSIYFEDTADVKFKLIDLAMQQVKISGGPTGPIMAQFSMVGSGKHLDGAMAGPALPTNVYLLGSDTDIKIGAVGAAASIKERVRSWEYAITNNMVPHFAPGGGLFSTFTKLGMQRATLSLQVAAKDADDLRTLFVNDTLQEVQINANSGAAAQLNATFKGVYLSAAQLGLDGDEEIWSLGSVDVGGYQPPGCQLYGGRLVVSGAAPRLWGPPCRGDPCPLRAGLPAEVPLWQKPHTRPAVNAEA